MTLALGSKLGPYEVVAPIGAPLRGHPRFEALVARVRGRA